MPEPEPGDEALEFSTGSASGFVGVYKKQEKWEARYGHSAMSIGVFHHAIEAARARHAFIVRLRIGQLSPDEEARLRASKVRCHLLCQW